MVGQVNVRLIEKKYLVQKKYNLAEKSLCWGETVIHIFVYVMVFFYACFSSLIFTALYKFYPAFSSEHH